MSYLAKKSSSPAFGPTTLPRVSSHLYLRANPWPERRAPRGSDVSFILWGVFGFHPWASERVVARDSSGKTGPHRRLQHEHRTGDSTSGARKRSSGAGRFRCRVLGPVGEGTASTVERSRACGQRRNTSRCCGYPGSQRAASKSRSDASIYSARCRCVAAQAASMSAVAASAMDPSRAPVPAAQQSFEGRARRA